MNNTTILIIAVALFIILFLLWKVAGFWYQTHKLKEIEKIRRGTIREMRGGYEAFPPNYYPPSPPYDKPNEQKNNVKHKPSPELKSRWVLFLILLSFI